jgi:broad specificity phosphatase PhoE
MRGHIHLVRHGPSAHVHDGSWMYAGGVRDFEAAYNAAEIDETAPPAQLVELARRATLLVASDMPRALASARRIAPSAKVTVLPPLRELHLEPPAWLKLKLPIQVWDAMSYLQWSVRIARDSDHPLVRRADEAAKWLTARSARNASIVAVTHGAIRRIIARCLERQGWVALTGRQGYENWSCWSYTS